MIMNTIFIEWLKKITQSYKYCELWKYNLKCRSLIIKVSLFHAIFNHLTFKYSMKYKFQEFIFLLLAKIILFSTSLYVHLKKIDNLNTIVQWLDSIKILTH